VDISHRTTHHLRTRYNVFTLTSRLVYTTANSLMYFPIRDYFVTSIYQLRSLVLPFGTGIVSRDDKVFLTGIYCSLNGGVDILGLRKVGVHFVDIHWLLRRGFKAEFLQLLGFLWKFNSPSLLLRPIFSFISGVNVEDDEHSTGS
jgi:hypothetical protein